MNVFLYQVIPPGSGPVTYQLQGVGPWLLEVFSLPPGEDGPLVRFAEKIAAETEACDGDLAAWRADATPAVVQCTALFCRESEEGSVLF